MKNKIFFTIFMITWVTLIILNIVIPKQTFSEQENRYLEKVPELSFKELVSGEYAEGLDNYINDHFIFRNFWLKLNSFVQITTGKTENNGVYIGKEGYLFEKFVYTENEKENIEKTVQTINSFAQNVDIPIHFLLIPNSIYINEDKLPDNLEIADQREIIENVYGKLNKDINTINVTNILKENKNLKLYYKTDHHMTSKGAYLVYTEYCKKANLESVPISQFKEEIVAKDFLGTFDSKAQVHNQEKDEIVVYKNETNENIEGDCDGKIYNSIFNKQYLKQKDKYSYFLNGNNAKVVIKTNIKNGKRLLVIKDSYAHILAQFICQNYEEIHFIDPRYYKDSTSEYAKENNITEILFLYNVSNILTDISIRTIK